MSSAASARSPWPSQTAAPSPPSSPLRRKRQFDYRWSPSTHWDYPRQSVPNGTTCGGTIDDQEQISAALQACFDSNNGVFSCYPDADTVVAQHEWAGFVWNTRLPQFTETNQVDIYLYNADSLTPVLSFLGQTNPSTTAGQVNACVNDTWFGERGLEWNGGTQTYSFYWEISPATQTAVGQASPLKTFAAIQTTYADSVASSISLASVASASSAVSASSASAASAASSRSAAATSVTGIPSSNASSTIPSSTSSAGSGSGSVQSLSSSSFPHWAIAVIVVLGFLALVACGVLAFFISRRMRNRRNSMLSHRGSMNSASPMMANAATGHSAQSPLLGSAALAAGVGGAGTTESGDHRPTSPIDGHDGASTMSRTSDPGLFSGADAAIMAAAFRTALRKPDFANGPGDDGESPDSNVLEPPGVLLREELAEEGRDIRSVDSSRGVRVETLSDAADDDAATTVRDDPH